MPATSEQDRGASALADKRRWTSFLTWAFVLAEMAGRDGFLPTAAHAGEDEAGRAPHAADDASAAANGLPNINVATAGEPPEPVIYQQAAAGPPLPGATVVPSELAHPASDPTDTGHGGAMGSGGGGGGGGSVDVAAAGDHVDSTSDAAIAAHLPFGGQFLAIDQYGEPLDLGLHLDLGQLDLGQTVGGLIGGVAHGLVSVPVAGVMLDSVGHTAESVISSLVPTVSVDGPAGGSSNAAGSHGSSFGLVDPSRLDFVSGPSNLASDLTTVDGRHTDFGIALNIGTGDAAHTQFGIGTTFDSTLLDTLLGDHLPGDLSNVSDALNHDQSLLRTAVDALT